MTITGNKLKFTVINISEEHTFDHTSGYGNPEC